MVAKPVSRKAYCIAHSLGASNVLYLSGEYSREHFVISNLHGRYVLEIIVKGEKDVDDPGMVGRHAFDRTDKPLRVKIYGADRQCKECGNCSRVAPGVCGAFAEAIDALAIRAREIDSLEREVESPSDGDTYE